MRSQSRISLTPAGERFLEEARKVVEAADRAVELAQRTARGEIGSITIAFLNWGAGAFLPSIIRGFRQLHPGVRVSIVELMPRAQLDALLNGVD